MQSAVSAPIDLLPSSISLDCSCVTRAVGGGDHAPICKPRSPNSATAYKCRDHDCIYKATFEVSYSGNNAQTCKPPLTMPSSGVSMPCRMPQMCPVMSSSTMWGRQWSSQNCIVTAEGSSPSKISIRSRQPLRCPPACV